MMHSGSNAEWKVDMGYLGYFVANAIVAVLAFRWVGNIQETSEDRQSWL